ncbi:MAG: hypothetical protein WAU17_00685 [Nitrospirales bacterium]
MPQPTPDYDHFRATLLTLQRELLAVSSTGQEAAQPVELDQTAVGRISRMDALQQQAMAQAAQQRRHIQLQRIESALQRLENGKFGWCVRCGGRNFQKTIRRGSHRPPLYRLCRWKKPISVTGLAHRPVSHRNSQTNVETCHEEISY